MGTKQKQKLNMIANIVGLLASFVGMVLTIILLYFNPYSNESNNIGTVEVAYATLFAPALFALISLSFKKRRLMFISFIWSLPMSLYLTGTPSIFRIFGITCIFYLVSALLFLLDSVRRK
jgi:hypothetical protein